MDIRLFIKEWLEVSNACDLEKYLEFYLEDATLDDLSVSRKFVAHKGIKEYFTSYFIEYKTHTKLVHLDVGKDVTHLEVLFTGDFPEGKIGGTFDFTFKGNKIASAIANLI
jgi:ketosteroid isomerase-like protein